MDDREYTTLSGVVEGIKYKNPESGYAVCELDVDGELIIIVGIISFIEIGEEIKVIGRWVLHPNYGRQFYIETYEKHLPASETSILKYLSGGAVKGIRNATAKKIVDKFGIRSLEIIENNPEELCQIRSISLSKANKINESFKQQFSVRAVLLFLQQYGISPTLAIKVWKRWGAGAVDIIKENPYAMCEEIYGVGFAKADEIAKQMNIANDSIYRIKAGIKYILQHNAYSNGHTFVPREQLQVLSCDMLGCDIAAFENALDELLTVGSVVQSEIRGHAAIYLDKFYNAEDYVAFRINMMCRESYLENTDLSKKISKLEKEFDIKYAQNQREAIEAAMQNKLMILTGGPGTGKTTALKGIITILEQSGLSVALSAPTGRAAKRLSELTGREAKTVHRLLDLLYNPEDQQYHFMINENNPLEYDVIICDEVSMLDIIVAEALLKAMPFSSRLILVGDADQLPPVGAGNIFKDLINSEKVCFVRLNEIFRQAAESLIVLNAHKIINGQMPDISRKDKDFFFLKQKRSEDVVKTIVDLCKTRLPNTYSLSPLWDIQVLAPGKKHITGTINLNANLRDALNPPSSEKKEKKFRDSVFREGDKVMQIKNNYDIIWKRDDGEDGIGVFNGDIGILEMINYEFETLQIRYEDKVAQYSFDMLEEIEPAYAITVHKSQGNEFPAVIISLYDGPKTLFYNKLLYTAVTRAKNLLIIVGDEEKIEQMTANNLQSKRFSGLKHMIINDR